MDRLNDVFHFEEGNEDYVAKLQSLLDELEELVLCDGRTKLPIFELGFEKKTNTLAYIIINLIWNNEIGSLSEKTFKKINKKIERAALEDFYMTCKALAEQN